MLHIMIADDEEIECNYLASIFMRFPAQYKVVAQAANGERAVQLAVTHRPDVIIMDINMPLLSGLEAARRIREHLPYQIIILNSAYAEFGFARQAVEYGLDGYLLKPSQEEGILTTITSCYRKRNADKQLAAMPPDLHLEYPYHVVDDILRAVEIHSSTFLERACNAYMSFLRMLNQSCLESYRLYVINTLFSIQQALSQSGMDHNLIALLDGHRAINRLGGTPFWHEILAVTEEFFARLHHLLNVQKPCKHDVVDLLCTYIDQNFTEKITLDQLAALAHFSPAYLSRVFHERKGTTISFYINAQRVAHACSLLTTTSRLIRDIAGDCGFDNLSHFHRVFKSHTSKTPSQVRSER